MIDTEFVNRMNEVQKYSSDVALGDGVVQILPFNAAEEAFHTSTDVVALRGVMSEIGLPQPSPTVIYCDNKPAIYFTRVLYCFDLITCT